MLTHKCASSCAMTKALVRPSSRSMAADLVLEQTPPTGAKPDGPPSCARVNHTAASHPVLSVNNQLFYIWNIQVAGNINDIWV